MNEQVKEVYTYDGILFSLRKTGNSDRSATTWTKLEDIILNEITQAHKDKYV